MREGARSWNQSGEGLCERRTSMSSCRQRQCHTTAPRVPMRLNGHFSCGNEAVLHQNIVGAAMGAISTTKTLIGSSGAGCRSKYGSFHSQQNVQGRPVSSTGRPFSLGDWANDVHRRGNVWGMDPCLHCRRGERGFALQGDSMAPRETEMADWPVPTSNSGRVRAWRGVLRDAQALGADPGESRLNLE